MIERIKNISTLEWLLMESIVLVGIWIKNSYLAKIFCLVSGSIFLATYIISMISEKVDPSKVSKSFFTTMLLLGIMPFVIYLIMSMIGNMF